MQNEQKAWGQIPLELTAGLRWQMIKDLWLTGSLWAWDGPQYLGKDGDNHKDNGSIDFNAGAEFRITKNFNLWVQFNNILNNEYERWHQYQTFGFNILGGITYSFNQK